MTKVLYHEEHDWAAFKHSKITMGLELIQTPLGFSVHIVTGGEPRGQHLTLRAAEKLYRDIAQSLWGFPVDPKVDPRDLMPVTREVYQRECTEESVRQAFGL